MIRSFDEEAFSDDPFSQLARWMREAREAGIRDSHAMVLATASPLGMPSTRAVLLKEIDAQGVIFYTNLHSRKAKELVANPQAGATLLWTPLERQVHLEGKVIPLAREKVEPYFALRPRGSQVTAWVSPHPGQPLADRSGLEQTARLFDAAHQGEELSLPTYWGGFHLLPERIEFWQAGPFRLHYRMQYTKSDGTWSHGWVTP